MFLDEKEESNIAATTYFSRDNPFRLAFFRHHYWPMVFVASFSQSRSDSARSVSRRSKTSLHSGAG
jgi:hypothetical protein